MITRLRRIGRIVALAGALGMVGGLPVEAADCEARASAAAKTFGDALKSGSASGLRSVLPRQGKVMARLNHLGPHEGFFSPGQIAALLDDFLEKGKVSSFEVMRIQSDESCNVLAQTTVGLTNRAGRPATVEVRLKIEPEGERLIVREIRETRR